MVSEDSQDIGWLAPIHRFRDRGDPSDPLDRPMHTQLHQIDDRCELLEVFCFRSSQLVAPEERNDDVSEVRKPRDAISTEVRPVIVMTSVIRNMTTPEGFYEFFQCMPAPIGLDHRKFRLYLPTKSRRTVSKDGTTKTALAIDKTGNPSAAPESFLLVFRTHHIFTVEHCQNVQITCNT